MKITLTFDSDNAVELDHAAGLVAYLQDAEGLDRAAAGDDATYQSAAHVKATASAGEALVAEATKKTDDAADKKAQAAADKKAKDAEAAAAKKAEEDAAAAAKKAEDEAAAAAEEVDPLGDAPVEKDMPKLDREMVRQALTDFSKIEGRPAAIAILNKHGAKAITELSEDKFRAVYDEANVRK